MKRQLLLLFVFLSTILSATDIAVVTIVNGEDYKEKVKIGTESKRKYCAMHGYDFFCIEKSLDTSRAIVWSKLPAILKLMENPQYKWIVWIDADTMFMNTAIRFEDVIDENYDFIISNDFNGMNAGVFLMRNCNASKKFLESAYNRTEWVGKGWEEQTAMDCELQSRPEYKALTKFVPQRFFNAYTHRTPGVGDKIQSLYQEGDFILHFCALNSDLKELFAEYESKIISDPSRPTLESYLTMHGWIIPPASSDLNDSYATNAQNQQFNDKIRSYQKIRKVLEIGLNAGHSANNFFTTCIGIEKLVSFDNKSYAYTQMGVDFLNRRYKKRFNFIEGDSKQTVPQYIARSCGEKFDLIYIDGDRSFEGRMKDIINCEGLATWDTKVWINDYDNPSVHEAITMCEKTGLLKVLEVHRSQDDWYGDRAWAEARYNF